jgi:hypothetical protein
MGEWMRNQKWLTASVCATVSATILAFWRPTSDVFDATKAVVLWLGALSVLPFLVFRLASYDRPQLMTELKSSWYALQFFGIALLTSLGFSDFQQTTIFGQAGRFTSLLTIASGILLLVAIRQVGRNGILAVLVTIVGSNFVSCSYSLLQASGNDPFKWQSGSFAEFNFGTMGNPNFATALCAVSTVLSLHFMVSRSTGRVLRTFSGASFGLCIGCLAIFDSFQGNIALAALVLLVIWSGLSQGRSINHIAFLTVGSLAVIALSLQRLPVMVIALLALVLGILMNVTHGWWSRSNKEGSSRNPKVALPLAIAIGVMGILGAVLLREQVFLGVASGFAERGDFYRAAWEGIKERPLVGHGLDTFGRYFTEYRPISHALRLENSRTSSVHSVFLGMAFSGGFVLFMSFAFFFLYPIGRSFAFVKSKTHDFQNHIIGVTSAIVALGFIFLVSTEHVAVYAVFFALAGCLSGLIWPASIASTPVEKHRRRQKRVRRSRRSLALTTLAVGVSVLLVPSAIRPMKAARLDYLGQVEYFAERYPTALEYFRRAASEAPWISTYHLRTAEMAGNLEVVEVARDSALAVAESSNYVSLQSVKAARITAFVGDLAKATEILEITQQHDPYAIQLGASIEELASTIRSVAEREGQIDVAARAEQLIDEIRSIRSIVGTEE